MDYIPFGVARSRRNDTKLVSLNCNFWAMTLPNPEYE